MDPRQPYVPPADGLRRAIRDSGLSYHELGRRARVSQAQLSRFVSAGRDITLAVASRLCEVLGLELVQRRAVRAEPLEAAVPTTRQRNREGLPPPESAEARGQGKRMDLPGAKGTGKGRRKNK